MPDRLFELEIRMANDALVGDGAEEELARILQNVVDRIKLMGPGEGLDISLRDVNGNRCGYAAMPEWDPPEQENDVEQRD